MAILETCEKDHNKTGKFFIGTVRCLLISGPHEYTSLLPVVHSWTKLNIHIIVIALNGSQWQLFVHLLETCEKNQNKTEKFLLHWHKKVLIDFRSPWIYYNCGAFNLQPLFQKRVEKWFQKRGSANSDIFSGQPLFSNLKKGGSMV